MYMYFLLMHTDQDETACGMSCTRTSATILIGYLTEPLGPSGPRGNVKLKNGKQCVIVWPELFMFRPNYVYVSKLAMTCLCVIVSYDTLFIANYEQCVIVSLR